MSMLSQSSHTSRSSLGPSTFSPGYSPSSWYSLSLRTTVLLILPVLSILGAYGTLTLGGTNGTFKAIIAMIASVDAKFPGTDVKLVKTYTEILWLDRQLTILVTFFAPVVDRNQGALTLFSFFGFGQFGAVWTLMMMESMRMGNRRRLVSYIGTVGLILQNISFTVTAPLYLFIHLLSSPVSEPFPGTHANSVLLIDPWDLRILPASITLGYILPTILMTLPSPTIVSSTTHQRLIAFWQPFPLWTVWAHWLIRSTLTWLSTKVYGSKPPSRNTPLGASYLTNAKHVYRFVLTLCICTNLPVLILTLTPSCIFPIPSLLHTLTTSTFSQTYIPYLPLLSYQVSSLAEGVHTFLIWDLYIGSFAFLCWAVLLYRNATTEKAIVDPNTSLPIHGELLLGERIEDGMRWRKLAATVGVWWVVGGPVGALAVLLWERDAIVRQKIKQGL